MDKSNIAVFTMNHESFLIPIAENIEKLETELKWNDCTLDYDGLKSYIDNGKFLYYYDATLTPFIYEPEQLMLVDDNDNSFGFEFLKTFEIAYDDELGIWGFKELMIPLETYSTPFDEFPEIRHYISYDGIDGLMGRVYSRDFAYFECPRCGRIICEQNPKNGYHVQCKFIEDEDGYVCNSCYETQLLEIGSSRKKLENYELDGLFLDNEDLYEFEELQNIPSFVNGSNLKHVCDLILETVKPEEVFLIQYNRLGLGGGEGYITVYKKKKEYV